MLVFWFGCKNSPEKSTRTACLLIIGSQVRALVRPPEAQDRPGELTGAAPGRGDGTAIWRFALVAAAMAAIVSPRAEACPRTTNGLRAGDAAERYLRGKLPRV
jgi:hypothetical protein